MDLLELVALLVGADVCGHGGVLKGPGDDALRIGLAGAEGEALRTLDRASQQTGDAPDPDGALAGIDDLRAAALAGQSRCNEAILAEQQALRLTPGIARRWQALSALYAAAGDSDGAAAAGERAARLALPQ